VWREEADVIVVADEPTRTQVLCVGGEIDLPTDEHGLRCTVTAIAKALEDPFEASEKEDRNASISRKLLLQTEITRFTPKVTFFYQLQSPPFPIEVTRPWTQAFDSIDDQVEIVYLCAKGNEPPLLNIPTCLIQSVAYAGHRCRFRVFGS
jgi:hypothetical protein